MNEFPETQHTNKIIVDILDKQYGDYHTENYWHYHREYKMIQSALDKQTEVIARKWWKVGLLEAGATDEDDFDKYFDDNHKPNI